jgi:hypothetical protein
MTADRPHSGRQQAATKSQRFLKLRRELNRQEAVRVNVVLPVVSGDEPL